MLLSVQVHSALSQAAHQVFAAHACDVNFTGCGIGLRQRGGCPTDEPAVIAMVTKKLPAGAISRSRLLPATVQVDGHSWGVDVVEVGPLTFSVRPGRAIAGPAEHGPITRTFRPLVQGCGVSDLTGPQNLTGTLGCMVRDTTDKTICILGSNTVLAQNGLLPGSQKQVIQPGNADGGGSSDEVATLKRYIPFTTSGLNHVDAAIAQIQGRLFSPSCRNAGR